MENILAFLDALRRNNDRTWFEANKGWYRDAKGEFDAFVGRLIGVSPLSTARSPDWGCATVRTAFIAIPVSAPTNRLIRPIWGLMCAGAAKSPVIRDIIFTSNLGAKVFWAVAWS